MLYRGNNIDIMRDMPDNSVDAIVTDPPYELGFMGKSWDASGIAYNVELWKECLRVLKPGGHLLAFGGTRTYHRMAVAIEDAGFEVRDMIEWVYGSGFPKSMNIGKAVDKLQGNERKVVGKIAQPGSTNNRIAMGNGWQEDPDLTKGTSKWEGWGTALKPAHEPICMARKPIAAQNIAENVLKYGTGGINIDGCRVPGKYETRVPDKPGAKSIFFGNTLGGGDFVPADGRFPANLIHDNSEEVRECFPETNPSKKAARGGTNPNPMDWGNGRADGYIEKGHDDNGGNASRFFKSIIYQAKASKRERNAGCEKLEGKDTKRYGDLEGTPEHAPKLNIKNANNHPTVKPIALMRYLVRLVTPKGGIVLDPFTGSGSTGVACVLEGFEFIGCELDPEYVKIAKARIASWQQKTASENPLFGEANGRG